LNLSKEIKLIAAMKDNAVNFHRSVFPGPARLPAGGLSAVFWGK
jgi:hypothetical protein